MTKTTKTISADLDLVVFAHDVAGLLRDIQYIDTKQFFDSSIELHKVRLRAREILSEHAAALKSID